HPGDSRRGGRRVARARRPGRSVVVRESSDDASAGSSRIHVEPSAPLSRLRRRGRDAVCAVPAGRQAETESGMKLHTTTPVLLVSDIAATLRWYRANLQFSGRAVPESPPHTFGIMNKDEIEIFLQQLAGYE